MSHAVPNRRCTVPTEAALSQRQVSLVAKKSHLKGPTKELGKSAAKKKGSEHCKLERKYV